MKDRNNKLRIYTVYLCVLVVCEYLKKGIGWVGYNYIIKGKKRTKTFINKLGQYRYKGFKNKAFIYLYS